MSFRWQRLGRRRPACAPLVLGMLLVGASAGEGQEAGKSVPAEKATAESVLEKYVQATGGRAPWEQLHSLVMKGVIVVGERRGSVEIYAKAPDKRLEIRRIDGSEIRQGYDGAVAWDRLPILGLREHSGDRLARRRRAAIFHANLKWRELYRTVELVGRGPLDDHGTCVLRLTTPEGRAILRTYDFETGLLLREEFELSLGILGDRHVQYSFEDYRPVKGVLLPFRVLQVISGEETTITKFVTIEANLPIDDALFTKPR